MVLAALASAGLANATTALAESCVYDGGAKTLTATIDPGSTARLKVGPANELLYGPTLAPVACGAATTANTDTITVTGGTGSNETIVLDHGGGPFGPGFTPESSLFAEIEMALNLGDVTDRVVIIGTEARDVYAAGQFGLALTEDGDTDIVVQPSTMALEFHVLGGDDYVNGRGQGGAGLKYLGIVDVYGGEGNEELIRGGNTDDILIGGPGNDRLEGTEGTDQMDGGSGDDILSAADGNDVLTGGPGADSFTAGDGADTIYAEDATADLLINGGPGTDTAYLDAGLDPTALAVEVKISTPPPPPTSGACTYNAATKVATAAMSESGVPATLKLVGGAIHFGQSTVAACGDATATNTDKINVIGTGGVDAVTIDQSGGAFLGGTPETDIQSEVEIALSLGEVTDPVTILGTVGNDNISVGQNGIALNADGDVDVTWAQRPAAVTIRGLAGVNNLGGGGGAGAGAAYNGGDLFLYAGDAGDTLRGSTGNDTLIGGAGNDTLDGRDGGDTIDGAGGADTLTGAGGSDTVTGGAGADTISGGDGTDTMYALDGEADTLLNGGPGQDTAFYDVPLERASSRSSSAIRAGNRPTRRRRPRWGRRLSL